jgi:hypothetical protein
MGTRSRAIALSSSHMIIFNIGYVIECRKLIYINFIYFSAVNIHTKSMNIRPKFCLCGRGVRLGWVTYAHMTLGSLWFG